MTPAARRARATSSPVRARATSSPVGAPLGAPLLAVLLLAAAVAACGGATSDDGASSGSPAPRGTSGSSGASSSSSSSGASSSGGATSGGGAVNGSYDTPVVVNGIACCPPSPDEKSGAMYLGGAATGDKCYRTYDFWCSTNWRIEKDKSGCDVWRYDVRAPAPGETSYCQPARDGG